MFGLTTQAEQGRYLNQNLRLADRLERKAIPRFAVVLQMQLTAAAATYAHTQSVTQAEAEVTKRQPEMKAAMEKTWWESGRIYNEWAMSAWAKYTRQRAKKAVSPAPGDFRAAMIWWTETHGGEQIKQVQETTKNYINTQVTRAAAEGEGPAQIAGRISDSVEPIGRFKYSATRARAIARTEVHNASEFALQATIDDIGEEMDHQWLAAEDLRTRPTHAKANGQRRDRNTAFTVGGSRMMYPGDSSKGAPAGEIINCRCTVMFWPKSEISPIKPAKPVDADLAGLQERFLARRRGTVAPVTIPPILTPISKLRTVPVPNGPRTLLATDRVQADIQKKAIKWIGGDTQKLTPRQFAEQLNIRHSAGFPEQIGEKAYSDLVMAYAHAYVRFPSIMPQLGVFSVQELTPTYYAQFQSYSRGIELNRRWFSVKGHPTMKSKYSGEVKTGHLVKTKFQQTPGTPLIYHELMHSISDILASQRITGTAAHVRKAKQLYSTLPAKDIFKQVSRYGGEDEFELLAEALTRLHLGGESSSVAVELHESIMADYSKIAR